MASKTTKNDHDALVKRWRALSASANGNAYDRAVFMCEARRILPNGEFGVFLSKDLCMRGGEIAMYTRMAEAVVTVNDAKVWSSLGWRGVSLLRVVKTKRMLTSVIRECMKQAVDGVVLDTGVVARAIYKRTGVSQTMSANNADDDSSSGLSVAKDVVGASVASTIKRSVSTETTVSASASAGSACVCGLSVLAEEVNDLINGSYKFIADLLSEKALAALKNANRSVRPAKTRRRERATA